MAIQTRRVRYHGHVEKVGDQFIIKDIISHKTMPINNIMAKVIGKLVQIEYTERVT